MSLNTINAANAYGLAKSAIGAAPDATQGARDAKPQNPAFDAAMNAVATVAEGERASAALLAGGADPHSVVEALAAAELVVETAVVVRDKVVEAYQELLRMPV